MPSADVLRAVSSLPWLRARSMLKAQRRSVPNCNLLIKTYPGLGFTNKYNTYSILNELRWALDPNAVLPSGSIVQVTKAT
jgi:hypothetical protein